MKEKQATTNYYVDGAVMHSDNCETLERAADNNKLTLNALSRSDYPGGRLPDNYLPELLSFGFWDCRKNQDWYLTPHRNEGIEITYLAKGNLSFGVDNAHFQLNKGDITFTRPWQQHYLGEPNIGYSKLFWLILDVKVRKPDDKWQWPHWIVLSPEDIAELTNRLQHTEQHVWVSNPEVQQIIEKLCLFITESALENTRSNSLIPLLINELLLLLLSLLKTKSYTLNRYLSSKEHMVERFLDDMANLCGDDWNLTTMAAECGLKRSQFSEYCYQIKGLSPIDYLKQCRVKLAKNLLVTTKFSITDIAFQTGFGSSQYFATVFKKLVGCTPNHYKLTKNELDNKVIPIKLNRVQCTPNK